MWVRLTVFLCPSVPCSWTPWRTEWYGFFVSSAHPGPTLPQVRGPEFPLQHCVAWQARPGLPLTLGGLSWPASPRLTELWADTGLVGAAERWSLSFRREPSLWGPGTGRSSRPHSPTRCPSAAAAWPCSSASWVSAAVPTCARHPLLPPGAAGRKWGSYSAGPASPCLPRRHHQRAVAVLRCAHGAQGALPVPKLPAALRRLPGPPGAALPAPIQVPLRLPRPSPGPSVPAAHTEPLPVAASPTCPSCRRSSWRSSAPPRPSSSESTRPSRRRHKSW